MDDPRQAPASLSLRFSVPWYWVISGMVVLAGAVYKMSISVSDLSEKVADMRIVINSGNTQVTTLAGEQALLRFRLENVEGEIRTLKGLPPAPHREIPR